MQLEGKVALVTGASRGIGRAIALKLAQCGADLALNYVDDPEGRNRQDAERVVAEIQQLGRRALLVEANVADEAAVDAMVAEAATQLGRIDILINNAGIVRDITLKKMTKQQWDEVIAVNLTGVFNCTRSALPLMREAGWGRIVSVASVVGQMGNIGQANYAASKAGIMGFTKSVARETARRGITVNAVAPGFISTQMLETVPEEVRASILSQIPAGRFGEPADVANVVALLASEEAGYLTGQVIHINGGVYM